MSIAESYCEQFHLHKFVEGYNCQGKETGENKIKLASKKKALSSEEGGGEAVCS